MFNTHIIYFCGDGLGTTLPCWTSWGPPGKHCILLPGLLLAGNQVEKRWPLLYSLWTTRKLAMVEALHRDWEQARGRFTELDSMTGEFKRKSLLWLDVKPGFSEIALIGTFLVFHIARNRMTCKLKHLFSLP